MWKIRPSNHTLCHMFVVSQPAKQGTKCVFVKYFHCTHQRCIQPCFYLSFYFLSLIPASLGFHPHASINTSTHPCYLTWVKGTFTFCLRPLRRPRLVYFTNQAFTDAGKKSRLVGRARRKLEFPVISFVFQVV